MCYESTVNCGSLVHYLKEVKKNVTGCNSVPFILLCCHPHQIQSPAALTQLKTTHKIRLPLLTPSHRVYVRHFKNFFPFHNACVHSLQSICTTFCQANPACLSKLSADALPTSSQSHHPSTHFLHPFFLCHF